MTGRKLHALRRSPEPTLRPVQVAANPQVSRRLTLRPKVPGKEKGSEESRRVEGRTRLLRTRIGSVDMLREENNVHMARSASTVTTKRSLMQKERLRNPMLSRIPIPHHQHRAAAEEEPTVGASQ